MLSTNRHYKTKPTHGIGRYKHLIKAQEVKGQESYRKGEHAAFTNTRRSDLHRLDSSGAASYLVT